MKPTSIISIIVALVLIVAGLITCFVAQSIASSNGEFIFSESRGDDYINTVEIGDSISKIELILSDAQINIYGGSDRSYIEFVNFSENYYSLTVSNTILSFDEIPDIMSMLKFWENGFSFKGMRYILGINSKRDSDAKKSVNIYVSDEQQLKIFDIQADSCTLDIKNIVSDSDYKLTVSDATVNVESVKTGGTFSINHENNTTPATSVKLNINYAVIKNLNISTKTLNTDIDLFKLSGDSVIECENGNIQIKFAEDPTLLNFDIRSEGAINISGDVYMNTFAHAGNPESSYKMKINTKNADISLAKTEKTTPPTTNAN